MKIGLQFQSEDKLAHRRYGEARYKKLKEHGFSCADFNLVNTDSEIYTLSQEKSDAILLKEKALAEEAGVEIHQVHGPWRWPSKDYTEEDRRERMDKMKKSIRATAVLGCKNWIVHPIMPFGTDEIGTENAQKTWDLNIEFMSELLKTAKEYDVTICLENMPMVKFSLATPKDILRFVKAMNDEHFKVCLDTGHVSVFEGLSVGDSVRIIGDELRTLHVHDNKWGFNLHLMPYYGVIDWNDFANALREINYNGVFSLETLPPDSLTDELYEELSISLAKIAKLIIGE